MKQMPQFFWPMGLMKVLERFAFHGMRVLLILYLTSDLDLSPMASYELYGAVLSLYYGTAVIGGWWADKYLGTVNAVLIGSIFMMIGYVGLAFANSYFLLILTLSFFIVGNLFYKSTAIVLFGFNYREHLDKRDKGFDYLFYFINIGSVLGMVVCGIVGQYFGWRIAFGLTGLAMVAKLWVNIKYYKAFKQIFNDYAVHHFVIGYTVILGGLAVAGSAYVLYHPYLLDYFVPIFLVLIFAYILHLLGGFNAQDRTNAVKLVFVFFITIVFLAFYEIKGSGLNVYLEYNVDRHYNGFLIPAAWFQSISALVIICTGFMFVKAFDLIKIKGAPVMSYYKYCAGFMLMILCFFAVFVGHSWAMFKGHQMGYEWFIVAYSFMAFAELLIFPIMFSSAFKLAPPKYLNFFMGLLSFSGFISNYLAAELAKLSAPSDPAAVEMISMSGFLALLFVMIAVLIILTVLMITFRKKYRF